MLVNLKAMIVVFAVAMAVFSIAKPMCLKFTAEADFARRRNVWFALTFAAFVSPSMWLFVLPALLLLVWGARKDTNPIAFYLVLMQVISQSLVVEIPVWGINKLFELNIYRILSFAILVPTAWRLVRASGKGGPSKVALMDALILSYIALQLVLFMPYESITNTTRRGFLFFVDVLVLYFVVSRSCTNRQAIVDAMASLCLAGAIYAPLALFETLRGWLLYQGIGHQWDNPELFSYAMRGSILRAEVSAGNPILLGYIMAIAFGFWLYLRSRVQAKPLTSVVLYWMWMGLLAAYSRGPWVVAALIFFAHSALSPHGPVRFFKTLLISASGAGLILVSPIGERVIDNLPFFGKVSVDTVEYRQRLAEVSWQLIRENPFLGRPDYMLYLEDMRQGQGIIDLVNTYASVAMSSGIVGLSAFIGFFVVGMWKAYRLAKSSAGADPDLSLFGANIVACMLGTLVIMATASFMGGISQMYWILAGIAAGYAQLDPIEEAHRGAPAPLAEPKIGRTAYRG